MKDKTSKKQKLEPAEAQNRCIWMTAGVISFKLCPINFDCEHCDFDKAMRTQTKSKAQIPKSRSAIPSEALGASGSNSQETELFFTFSPREVKDGIYLHPAHLWIQKIGAQRWKVGIDELLAYILPQPTKLEFSDLNKDLAQEQLFGKIITPAGVIFLTTPLSGQLVQTNPKLAQYPEMIQQDPYGEGWMAVIEWNQDPSELEKFYTGSATQKFLKEEALHLKFFLRHRGLEVNQIGETLPDGGIKIKHLRQFLPAKICLRLTNELISTGKQAW